MSRWFSGVDYSYKQADRPGNSCSLAICSGNCFCGNVVYSLTTVQLVFNWGVQGPWTSVRGDEQVESSCGHGCFCNSWVILNPMRSSLDSLWKAFYILPSVCSLGPCLVKVSFSVYAIEAVTRKHGNILRFQIIIFAKFTQRAWLHSHHWSDWSLAAALPWCIAIIAGVLTGCLQGYFFFLCDKNDSNN